MSKKGLLNTAITSGIDKRPKPAKREKQSIGKMTALGAVLFGIVVFVTLIMQMGRLM